VIDFFCFVDVKYYFKLIFIQSNPFSVQKKHFLKNGIHKVILYLIAGMYLLATFFLFLFLGCITLSLIDMFVASNVDRLRDFIKHVYVDRRFTGERSYDKPPRVKVVKCLLSSIR
jgi:hypothetical protein